MVMNDLLETLADSAALQVVLLLFLIATIDLPGILPLCHDRTGV